ncbi:hypothetical protein [Paraliobacillus ryukyuensis]|uniref:hypothetical protein n=1 Tax=Paraliobacillus ryukyuensis TaxID=200904 RepID=UPI0009A5EDC8|nr:hypothetical protein [Paraliobacillus ryukyuensis]
MIKKLLFKKKNIDGYINIWLKKSNALIKGAILYHIFDEKGNEFVIFDNKQLYKEVKNNPDLFFNSTLFDNQDETTINLINQINYKGAFYWNGEKVNTSVAL